MKNLEIDIETYSSVSLQKCGVYKYAESPDFEILLLGYSVDGGDVSTIDIASGEEIPKEVLEALTDESVTKWAFNAQFERVCLSRYLSDKGLLNTERFLDPASWKCSMIWSAYMGLPLSLEGVGAVLGLEKQKLSEGKELIRFFSVPCKPTKANGGRIRNLPEHAPDKWVRYKAYNIRDVETEMQIQEKLKKFPVPDMIWEEYCIDQEINDRGIRVDLTLADSAMEIDEKTRDKLTKDMKDLTDLDNPNSVSQIKSWLSDNGLKVDTLGKKAVANLIDDTEGDISEVLSLRLQISKSSVKKYQAMENAACSDDRCRGMFQFYGANRTGRFAGRLVQLQNLPQNHMPDLKEARELVREGNVEALELLYDDIPDTLSQLIRTAFIPADGKKFYVADFSAIEARTIAWLAGEEWRMQVFADGGDIYCESASQMFKVPVVKHGINGHLRQKGKIAELALGYGGSVGALKSMGAIDMGLDENELQPLVDAWRQANPNIVRFWWDIDSAIKKVIRNREVKIVKGIKFFYQSGMLFITLPSGRNLCYVKPRIGENRFGGESVTYEGVGSTKKWDRIESYGPKFTENIIQGISRDILMYAMKTLHNFDIVAHVHDELIIEADPKASIAAICEQMGRVPSWAEGLILRADGYVCDFYMKD
ncbi:DNA polymerase [Butyrivibrio sp. WCD2001]|uniref:DNA polymerase n=1 Tax=Butyrivibrio sp. WCD2001 TaxID=1280681 RepID=UPI00041E4C8B|nr:DNA polymerase [Butyrivibrio sp. WCD2001]